MLWDNGKECRFDGSRVHDCSSQSAEAKPIDSLRPSSFVTPPLPNTSASGVCFLLGRNSEALLGRARLPFL